MTESQYLYNSRQWMAHLESHFDQCQDYFKFAMVWMSFNSYYSSRYEHIRGELNQIIEFSKDTTDLYRYFMQEGGEFENVINEFRETKYLYGNEFREKVADMRIGSSKVAYFNNEHKTCEDFFKVVYQIRCNLFHGNKEVENERNLDLVRWAYKYLNIYWKKFLDNNS